MMNYFTHFNNWKANLMLFSEIFANLNSLWRALLRKVILARFDVYSPIITQPYGEKIVIENNLYS